MCAHMWPPVHAAGPLRGLASGGMCVLAWLVRGPSSQLLKLDRGPSACPEDSRRQGGLLVTVPPPGWTARSVPSTRAQASHLCPLTTGGPSHAWGHVVEHTGLHAQRGSVPPGQAWSSGSARVLHPGPSPGTLPLSLVQHGTSAQPGPVPRPCPRPRAPAGACLCLQGPVARTPPPLAHMEMAEQLPGRVLWGLQIQQLNRALHPQPRQRGRQRGLPGDRRDPGWSHPVVKAPAISLPCHWPGHSKAEGTSPRATQGVCMCSAAGSGREAFGARLLRNALTPSPAQLARWGSRSRLSV